MGHTDRYPCPHCGYVPRSDVSQDYTLRPGTILHGKYVVGTPLGQGGFGITYIGWDLAMDTKVAIKEYFPSGQAGRNFTDGSLVWYRSPQAESARSDGKESFLREARKMNRVQDIPQVVRIRNLFQQNETAYIVMEFVAGKTLKQHVDIHGPLSWEQAKAIVFPTVKALEQIHEAGIIHRDLSPDNLMLLPDGTVKILDLGAAKDRAQNPGTSSVQVAKGGFSPPELYTQRGGSGTWTDVYALAATLYYSLTGVIPPSAVDRLDKDTLRWDLPQLSVLPTPVLAALQNAMTLHVKRRTQTMAVFAAQLQSGHISNKWLYALLAGTLAAAAGLCLFLAITLATQSGRGTVSPPMTSPSQGSPSVEASAPLPTADDPFQEDVTTSLPILHQTFSAGRRHTVAILENGTVASIGQRLDGQTALSDWTDMASISASVVHTAGLKTDGTAVALGSNEYGQCDLSDWTDLVSISAGFYHTVGLRADGAVVAKGSNEYGQCNVAGWTDIVAISAGWYHTVGLKSDGTVLSTGWEVPTLHDVNGWGDIVAISAGGYHTVALRADGTVLATGRNTDDQCQVSAWRDIVAIDTGMAFTVGLKADGTVVAVGANGSKQCSVGSLRNITAIAAGSFHVIAMKEDGTLVGVGDNDYRQCDVSQWRNIRWPDRSNGL